MSLIYNSLKQHEKKTGSLAQVNSISHKTEQDKISAKVVWLVLIGVGNAILIGLVNLQVNWQVQAKDGHANSENHLVQASEDNEISDFSIENEVANKEVELKRNGLLIAQKDSDISPVPNDIGSNTTTEDIVIQDEQSAMAVDKSKGTEPTKIVAAEVENEIEKSQAKSAEKVMVVDRVAIEKVKPAKQVEQKEVSVSASTEPSIEKVQTLELAKLEKPREVRLAVVPDKKLEVKKPPEKPINIALNQPSKLVAKVTPNKRIMRTEPKPASSQPQGAVKVEQKKIEKNSIDYFVAVKRKVSEIKQSVNFKDFKAANKSLNQLETLSGSESVIYQRMNAYTALKDHRYQEAATGYQKLLNQQPEDLEANMNLVIVLSEMGEKQTAKQQLSRLDNLYPESSRVKQYKKLIQAKYGY